MNVLITGSSTVGKSTLARELQSRGYRAIDGDDEPGLCRLEIKETGEPAIWPAGFVDWSYYSWNLQEPVLRRLLEVNENENVLLAGIFGNQPKYYHLFDKIIALTINPVEHAKRLAGRPRRDAGDSERNMAERLSKYQTILQRFLDAGAIPIDASGTPEQTADLVIKELGLTS